MKSSSSAIVLVIVCGVVACALTYLNRPKNSSPPVPIQPSANQTESAPEKIIPPKQESPKIISENTDQPAPVSLAAGAGETKSDDSTNAIRKSVDALLSAKSAAEKHDLFQQLVKSGQIDAAIAELKQRAADNPNDPEIPTTLGEAQLNQLRAIRDAGGDQNDIGILAMQADQSFNAALKIDPSNWEAQFVKASALSGWPVELNKGPEVIQQLSSLIDQQETMPSQPQFAQSYVMLGNEYLKIGQPVKAAATWQLGLTKFPNDPTLLKKISGQ
jgi:tetratricopeptide (TPR) repeat protein